MTGTRPLLRLGVSRCLLGDEVRYDGGHRHEPFVADRLGLLAEWVVVCPEFEVGLGVPREPIALYGDPDDPSVRGVESGVDHTRSLRDWSTRRLDELDPEGLDGFVLKSGSPSCALEPITVDSDGDGPSESPGLFVRALREWDASLPLCDELRLRGAEGQHAFFLRVFSRRFARGLRPRLARDDWSQNPLWEGFFDAHALALWARELDPAEVRAQCQSNPSARAALTRLAQALGAEETAAGRAHAFATAVEWMPELDRQTWLVLCPMLEEVRAGEMEPEVLRITLQLMAKSTGAARLADQLFLRPLWMGPNGSSQPAAPLPRATTDSSSHQDTSS